MFSIQGEGVALFMWPKKCNVGGWVSDHVEDIWFKGIKICNLFSFDKYADQFETAQFSLVLYKKKHFVKNYFKIHCKLSI